jgi:hypothetical protein
MFKKDDIVSAVTPVGEFVGKFVSFENNILTLAKPKGVGQSQEGIGLMDGVCISGTRNPEEVKILNVVLVAQTNLELANGYRQAIGSVLAPMTNIDMSKFKL